MQINLNNFEVWQGWSQQLPLPTASPEKNLILNVAYGAVDQIINQYMEGVKWCYTVDKSTSPAFTQALDDFRRSSCGLHHWFNLDYFLPNESCLEGIRLEINFYGIKNKALKDFSKVVVITVDESKNGHWVLGN